MRSLARSSGAREGGGAPPRRTALLPPSLAPLRGDGVPGLRRGPVPRGRQREANLFGLWQRARYFDAFATSGLDRFIGHVDALEEAGEEAAPPPALGEGEEVVRVMSVHQSKGLEFPVVILGDLDRKCNRADGRRPLIYHRDLGIGAGVVDRERKGAATPRWPTGPSAAAGPGGLAEEMRLLYVALTRAKEKLILVGPPGIWSGGRSGGGGSPGLRGWHLPSGRVVRAPVVAGLDPGRAGPPPGRASHPGAGCGRPGRGLLRAGRSGSGKPPGSLHRPLLAGEEAAQLGSAELGAGRGPPVGGAGPS